MLYYGNSCSQKQNESSQRWRSYKDKFVYWCFTLALRTLTCSPRRTEEKKQNSEATSETRKKKQVLLQEISDTNSSIITNIHY